MPPLPRFDYTLPVLQLMRPTANVTRTSPSASAFRAAIDMVKARVSSLAVMEGESGKMLGILTERDFFMKLPLANKGQSRLSLVSELMTPAGSIVTAKPSHTVLQCVSMMRKHKVRNLPVMDKQEEVQAVLGMQDVSRQIFNTFKKGDAEAAAITIGDLLDDRGVQTPGLSASLPHTASVADAIGRMRELSSGSLLVTGDDAKRFGLFTERDFLYNVVLYDEKSPAETPLHEVSRFTVGTSKATMAQISSSPALGDGHRPEHVTCVERKTRVIDCLSLMLGSGLLYVPVTENKQPINIISMRDINLFLSSNV